MSRTFTQQDSLDFARLSGDYNPIHLDPIAARRMMFGGTILHGMHLALAMAEQCVAGLTTPLQLTRITGEFRRPGRVGEPIDFAFREQARDRIRVEALSRHIALMTLTLEFASRRTTAIEIPTAASHPMQPKERSLSELRGCAGRLPLWAQLDLASRLFPNLVRLLPVDQLAVLLATSRLVGMEAPGLYSVWRGFELSECPDRAGPELTYEVERIDERFALVDLHVDAPGLSGSLSTSLRPKAIAQADYDSVRSLVKPDEFRQERAMVIGGSRGLGEIAVKLLAAGGADVWFSYHLGASDASRVSDEITRAGGSATCFQYDVLIPPTFLPRMGLDWNPTLLCYFATPFIFGASGGGFSVELFQRFCDFYVTGFIQTLASVSQVKRVLYPSSTAIEAPVPNLMAYAAAKAAGESLCRSLSAAQPGQRFLCPRFDRLATDQTATLLRVSAADPVQPVLAALRDLMK